MTNAENREGGEAGERREDGELKDSELKEAAGGRKKQHSKNRQLFRTLEQDMLFRRIERKGWNR